MAAVELLKGDITTDPEADAGRWAALTVTSNTSHGCTRRDGQTTRPWRIVFSVTTRGSTNCRR